MRVLAMVLSVWLVACGSSGGDDAGTGDGCKGSSKSLLDDPGFECTPSKWQSIFGDLEIVPQGRSGKAAKLTYSGGAGAKFAYAGAVVADGQGQTYCVQSWVTGTAPVVKTQLITDTGTAVEFAEPLTTGFTKTPPVHGLDLKVPAGRQLKLTFYLPTTGGDTAAQVGQSVTVDDVDVWVSSSGKCDEQR